MIKNHIFLHIFHMISMNVIMVGDGFRGVRRVRMGVLEWFKCQTRHEKVCVGDDMHVFCVYGQENSRDVMHELGRGDKGQEMSWGRCIWVQMDAIGYTHM